MARNWTRDEEIVAFILYCKTPFGKIHSSNPEIKRFSALLKRTPASVSMKMCNFARFDSDLHARGVFGLQNGSKLDKEIWDESNNNWEALLAESNRIIKQLGVKSDIEACDDMLLPIGQTRSQLVETRVNQAFFRSAVLSSYENKCCITGLAIPSLLIASHIKPWSVSNPATERTNPHNGLCLNALHDKAFDKGLITISSDYRIILSNRLKNEYTSTVADVYFKKYDGTKITLPSRFSPSREFLEYHNMYIFQP